MLAIGETGKYINGVAFKPTDWSAEGRPIVRIQNLTDPAKPMNRTTRIVDPAYVVQPGDLLVSWSATLDAFIWSREPALLNQHIFKVVPNTEVVSKKYLFFALRQAIIEMGRTEHLHGSTMKHINRGPFLAHRIRVPPLRAQAEIVAELEKQFSRLDEAVANLKRVKANLKRYKAVILDAAVRGRLGAESSASDESLPVGWRWTTVGEIATVGTGATPARSNDAFYRGGTTPWITSSAVNEPFVDAAEQFVTDAALQQTNLTLYPPGTLLVAMYGEGKTRGKCSELRIAATTNQALAALQADPVVRPWLKLFLEHNYDNTRRVASGGVQPNLNLGLIRAIKLPLPPASEQHRIVAEVDRRLSIVREVEAEVDANLRRAQALRQAVLAKAFAAPEVLDAAA
jgi:type I restriction enzyme S subunit